MITTEETKTPICVLIDNKYLNDYLLKKDFKIKNTLYIKNEDEKDITKLDISLDNLTPFPSIPNFFRCFIFGSSGSGKTTLLCNLLNLLNKKNDKMFVLFFSSILNDDRLDKQLKKLFKNQVLKLTQKGIINDLENKKLFPLNLDDLFQYLKFYNYETCTVCFDDCDSMTNKNIKSLLNDFMNEILERGRSHTKDEPNINLICIKHESGDISNKKLFLECEYIYFNLQVLHQQRLLYLCNKFNLEPYKDELLNRKLKGDNMCCISTKYPFFYFTNNFIQIVK